MRSTYKWFILITVVTVIYYFSLILIYSFVLPNTILEGTLSLDSAQPTSEINVPEGEFRTANLDVWVVGGSAVDVSYVMCSDDFKDTVGPGSKFTTHAVLSHTVYFRLVDNTSSAEVRYRFYDRVSLLVPKSSYDACYVISPIVYIFNISALYITGVIIVGGGFWIYKKHIKQNSK